MVLAGLDLVSRIPRANRLRHIDISEARTHLSAMTIRTTVRLPPELLRQAKRKASAEGRTLTALIEDGLRHVVSATPRPKKARRVSLPVSRATGGAMPGIDLARTCTLDEMDDLERLARLR